MLWSGLTLPDDILPEALPATPAAVVPTTPAADAVERRCEFCGSKLDKRGRLIERGPKVREMMDAEDTIATLRKDLATERAAHGETRQALSNANAKLERFAERKFGACL